MSLKINSYQKIRNMIEMRKKIHLI